MKRPIHIRFTGMESSQALFDAAHSLAHRLAWDDSEIIACWVVIHRDPEQTSKGPSYRARVDIKVPGHELIAKSVPYESGSLALAHAFEDIKQQLADIDPRINHDEYAVTVPGMLLTGDVIPQERGMVIEHATKGVHRGGSI